MATKMKKSKEFFERTEFLKLISTLSLKELMTLEFQVENESDFQTMVVCKDQQKKMFLCGVCNVFQYGEKNLFSHMAGKKHCCKMESVQQLYFPNNSVAKTTTKNIKNVQKKVETNVRKIQNVKVKEKREETLNSTIKSVPITKPSKPNSKTLCKPLVKKPVETKINCSKPTAPDAPIKVAVNKDSMPSSNNKASSDKSDRAEEKTVSPEVIISDSNPSEDVLLNKGTKDLEEHNKVASINSVSKDEQVNVNNETVKDPLAHNETDSVDALSTVSEPDIVINPLSKITEKQKKISCVPISKLISLKQPVQLKPPNDTHNTTEIVPASEPSNETYISNHNEEVRDKSDEVQIEKRITLSGSQGSTFESTSNISDIMGLLGVEYVIKIVKNMRDRSPRFQCCLCNISTDELAMHNHLLSYNHRLQFCEKHYPTAIRQYRQYISHVPEHHVFKVLSPILDKLAMAIEKHHGRETAYLCYEYSFTKNRQNIVSTVFNRRHASEVLGPAFTHVVDAKEVDILIEKATNGTFQSTSSIVVRNTPFLNTFNGPINTIANRNAIANYPKHRTFNDVNRVNPVDDETHKRMVDMFLRDTRHNQPMRNRSPHRAAKRSRSRSRSTDRKRNRTIPLMMSQWNLERKSLSPLRDGDIWQAYRHMVDQSVRELNMAFDIYTSDPEKHPLYKEEWQKFWKRRKDELIAAGINHRSYNYQNEWILFFNARLKELYNQDIENIKIKCRERLCLPMTNDELSNSKYHVHISENFYDYSSPDKSTQKSINETTIKNNEAMEDVKVIHVLRLLTALEDHLGSLGPSITELLAKSLQIFKQHPDNANALLLTNENCAILETAKEKFTGLIISKILDPVQERALKKAINDTEQLLTFATKIRKETTSSTVEHNFNTVESLRKSDKRSDANILYKDPDRIDKAELAAKLASSLISQGKTSINQEQLQQIVQVYSLIEQKKQKDPISSTRCNNNQLSPVPAYKQNTFLNEPRLHENTTNIFDLNTSLTNRRKQINNFNYNNDRLNLTENITEFPNSSFISGKHDITTSANYLSANMARINNTNIKNPTNMEHFSNGQDSQYHEYDCEQYGNGASTINTNDVNKNKRNQSSSYMDNNYTFGPYDMTAGRKNNWI